MVGRPEKPEAAEFFWTYIDKAPGEDIFAVFARQAEEAKAVLASISEEQSLHRYAPGKWSLREVLNHVTDTERIFTFRALWLARGLAGALPAFDQDVAASGAQADGVAWAAHVEEFFEVRAATISLFRNLPQEAWMRTGIANERLFSVRALAFVTAGHAAHHLEAVRSLYLRS